MIDVEFDSKLKAHCGFLLKVFCSLPIKPSRGLIVVRDRLDSSDYEEEILKKIKFSITKQITRALYFLEMA